MIPDPEAFPVLELSPAELLAEHGLRIIDDPPSRGFAVKALERRQTRWVDGQWVSLSRARLGPEEPKYADQRAHDVFWMTAAERNEMKP